MPLKPEMKIGPDGSKRWYLNGVLHRTDGPAGKQTTGLVVLSPAVAKIARMLGVIAALIRSHGGNVKRGNTRQSRKLYIFGSFGYCAIDGTMSYAGGINGLYYLTMLPRLLTQLGFSAKLETTHHGVA